LDAFKLINSAFREIGGHRTDLAGAYGDLSEGKDARRGDSGHRKRGYDLF
jgi:hypothetical protein